MDYLPFILGVAVIAMGVAAMAGPVDRLTRATRTNGKSDARSALRCRNGAGGRRVIQPQGRRRQK